MGLYDTLRGVICGYTPASAITGCWQSLEGIADHMLNFLENHDEQRIASDFFAGNGRKGKPGMIVSACMNTNPVMLYFGQEFGERGMQSEGFSGRDGRTTIFDYWNVDTIARWRHKNKFDGTLLHKEETELYRFYTRLMTICTQEKAITQGRFFDLMYVNYENWNFNSARQYAFLRKQDNEVLLIIANFDEISAHVSVNIPAHAFEYLDIPPMACRQAIDLLTGEAEQLDFTPDKATQVYVDGFGGKILKFTF